MNFLRKIWSWLVLNIFSNIHWNSLKALFNGGKYWELTEEEQDKLRKMLAKNHYIILIRRKTHLTTYLISIATWWVTGKKGYWSHVLMNLEGDIKEDIDFKLMEATGKGTHYSSFMQVFDCDAVALLVPRSFTAEDWTETLDKLRTEEGLPYDDLFDLTDARKVSCVEMARIALQGTPDYEAHFYDFEEMIKKDRNLLPDMFYRCKDFKCVYEIRH